MADGGSTFHDNFSEGVHQAFQLIVHGDPIVVSTTLRTLRLGIEATTIAAAVGLPLGCALGMGRFRGRRVLLGLANGLTKVPPVLVGVLALLLLYPESPWGGGPLAGLGWYRAPASAYFVQALLATPIVVALTATAVQGVAPALLEQARAFGAPRWRCGVLALREARAPVLAGILVAMGVAITAVGAILVAGAGVTTTSGEPASLATGALTAFTTDPSPGFNGAADYNPVPLAVAYATILLGLFVLIAGMLTRLQRGGLARGSGPSRS